MADDLGDDWWSSQKDSQSQKSKKRKHVEENDEELNNEELIEKPKKSRKKDDSDGANKNKKIKNEVNTKFEKRTKHSKKKSKAYEGTVILSSGAMIDAISKHHSSETAPSFDLDAINLKDEDFSLCNDETHTIVSFIKTLFPKWKRALQGNDDMPRRPIIIIVCSSAIRCVELLKQLRDLKSEKCEIAKLFAKHMKMEKTQDYLKSKTIHIAIGTPHRIRSLISSGDISLDSVKQTILDMSYKDTKKSTMMDIKIVKTDLMDLLSSFVIPHVKQGSGKIALF